jgi:hypothetical protein
MRATAQLLFLLFYIASSYAKGQERTAFIASRLVHSGTLDQCALQAGHGQLDPAWPEYREAKPKTICATSLGISRSVPFREQISEQVVQPPLESEKSLCSLEHSLDRAPPK